GAASVKAGVFPDCSYSPPPGWNSAAGEPVFVLSQDYPTTDPSPSLEQPWKAIDFRQQPAAYMQAVIDTAIRAILKWNFADRTTLRANGITPLGSILELTGASSPTGLQASAYRVPANLQTLSQTPSAIS